MVGVALHARIHRDRAGCMQQRAVLKKLERNSQAPHRSTRNTRAPSLRVLAANASPHSGSSVSKRQEMRQQSADVGEVASDPWQLPLTRPLLVAHRCVCVVAVGVVSRPPVLSYAQGGVDALVTAAGKT